MDENEWQFLEGIRANPADLNGWLVLADWLEERGDPRAELLRIRQELLTVGEANRAAIAPPLEDPGVPTALPNRVALEERMQELLRAGVEPVTVTEATSIGMQLVLIPPGEFVHTDSVRADEYERLEDLGRLSELTRLVQVTEPFYLGAYPVTQEQYEAIMGTNPSVFRGRNRPVEHVTWEDASQFCRLLSASEEWLENRPDYCLPTDAQWEYACRGGTTSHYALGEHLSAETDANFNDSSVNLSFDRFGPGETTPVGSYRCNSWGLYDMLGNVYEYCVDTDDADWPFLRGGSWLASNEECASNKRGYFRGYDRSSDIGFRVCRAAT